MSESWQNTLKKIDPIVGDFCRTFSRVIDENIPWLIVGATARDLHCYRFNLPIARATRDIDLALQLQSWREFQEIKYKLLQLDEFSTDSEIMRIRYREVLPIDLIPFGGVADDEGIIRWPPRGEVEMSVVGFGEALRSAEVVQFCSEPNSSVRITSPAGLVMLKFLSWQDAPQRRAKDIQDIAYVINNYLEFENWDRLIGKDSDLTDMKNFSTTKAAATMLGRDIRDMTGQETRGILVQLLSQEIERPDESRVIPWIERSLLHLSMNEVTELLISLMHGLRSN